MRPTMSILGEPAVQVRVRAVLNWSPMQGPAHVAPYWRDLRRRLHNYTSYRHPGTRRMFDPLDDCLGGLRALLGDEDEWLTPHVIDLGPWRGEAHR